MNKKIKILHIQETIASGGVERRRLSLAKHLDKNFFHQKFVCSQALGNIPDEIRAEGFEVISIGNLNSPFDWKKHKIVQKIIKDYQPDIIHGAVFEGVTVAAINGWMKKVPIIIIEETSDPKNRSWRGNLLMKVFSKMANIVIGVSEAVTKEYLIEKLGISPNKAITINNGVALPSQISRQEILKIKEKWGINQGDFIIGTVGRMMDDNHKRFSDLIKAFALFSKNKGNVKLLMVGGNDKYLEKYKVLAEELEVLNKIIFAGYQKNVSLYYQLMDVFALVSSREAFGLVLAEAMLNKLPVVATKVGGMKYIVDDKKTGFLVETFQVQEIQEKFEILYTDENTRKEMGKAGYDKAKKEFTEQVYVKKISDLYKKLMKK